MSFSSSSLNKSKSREKFPDSETGAAIKALLGLGSVLLIALFVLVYVVFGTTVPPGYVGVRRIAIGPGQGYWEKGLEPGLHWILPGYSSIYLVPQTVQALHLHRDKKLYPDTLGDLDIQTTDGAKVSVDVTLLARFFAQPGDMDGMQHGGPASLLKEVGLAPKDWFNRIRRNADDALRRALGKLSTAQFYNPYMREEQVEIALDEMNNKLARFGVNVESVLLRRYTYEAEAINEAIFRKNLQEQEERLNATLTQFAEVGAELERRKADFDAQIKTLKIEGESEARVIRSEGELAEKRLVADGDLLVAKSRAEVDRLRAGVLAKSVGADIYVARELAPILGSLKGGIVTDIDPYDLQKWVNKLGVDASASERGVPASSMLRGTGDSQSSETQLKNASPDTGLLTDNGGER